jgi:hypothetical protein
MKKTNICKILCAIVMIPSISLAMENEKNEQQIIAEAIAKKEKEIKKTLPSTPQIKEQVQSQYPSSDFSPVSQSYFVNKGVERERKSRDIKLKHELSQVEFTARMEIAQQKGERKRENERQRQEKLINQAKLVASQTEQQNRSLLDKVQALSDETQKLQTKLSRSDATTKYTRVYLDQMETELEQKNQELQETQEKLNAATITKTLLELKIGTAKEGNERLEEGLKALIEAQQKGLSLDASLLSSPVSSTSVTDTVEENKVQENQTRKKTLPRASFTGGGKEDKK